jgi:hypothetical protein
MWILVATVVSAAITSIMLIITVPYWRPWVETQVLTACKDYHATQKALEAQKAWTLPSGQVIPPLIPMETPFK